MVYRQDHALCSLGVRCARFSCSRRLLFPVMMGSWWLIRSCLSVFCPFRSTVSNYIYLAVFWRRVSFSGLRNSLTFLSLIRPFWSSGWQTTLGVSDHYDRSSLPFGGTADSGVPSGRVVKKNKKITRPERYLYKTVSRLVDQASSTASSLETEVIHLRILLLLRADYLQIFYSRDYTVYNQFRASFWLQCI